MHLAMGLETEETACPQAEPHQKMQRRGGVLLQRGSTVLVSPRSDSTQGQPAC